DDLVLPCRSRACRPVVICGPVQASGPGPAGGSGNDRGTDRFRGSAPGSGDPAVEPPASRPPLPSPARPRCGPTSPGPLRGGFVAVAGGAVFVGVGLRLSPGPPAAAPRRRERAGRRRLPLGPARRVGNPIG